MKKTKLRFALLALAISGLILLSLKLFYPEALGLSSQKRASLLNPLLRYTKFRELKSFRGKLNDLIEKEKAYGLADDVAIYFRSLTVGIWIGINEKEIFSPASILKIPVMMTYFRLAQEDPDVLKKMVKYKSLFLKNVVPGVLQDTSAKDGEYYSIDELIRFMIIESDNNADMLLMRNLPPGALEKTFSDFGVELSRVSANADFASPKLIATFLRVLYNASYLNEKMSKKALGYLTQCKYRDGIAAGLPQDVTVAHKFGERFFEDTNKRQLHEVAIVYYQRNPYVLAILTKGDDYDKLSRVLREISQFVYQQVDYQYKNASEDSKVEIE